MILRGRFFKKKYILITKRQTLMHYIRKTLLLILLQHNVKNTILQTMNSKKPSLQLQKPNYRWEQSL